MRNGLIYVLMSDGTDPGLDRHHNEGYYDSSPLDLDGDGTNDIQYAATRTNISRVFNILASRLTPSDHLFIYTTDHGGREFGMDVYMNLWNNEIIRDDEFAREVNKVNAGKVNICMEQCHSGGFIDNLAANNRVIATACRYDEVSYAMSNLLYDEFVYHWTAAVSKRTPSGSSVNADRNGDGKISMEEALQYAQANNSKSEHPQYSSTPTTLGQQLYLNNSPFISGPTEIEHQATYTIQNLPTGSSVRWSTNNGNLQLVSGQGTKTAVFRKNGSGECVIQATFSPSNLTITYQVCARPSRPTRIKGMKSQLAPNSQYGFWIDDAGDADYIEWTVWGGRIIGGQGASHLSVETASQGAFHIQVSKRNNCGWSGSCNDYGTINPGLAPFSLSPNPATDIVTLKLTTEEDDGILSPQGQGSMTTKGVTSTYEIQLWNGLTMLRSFKTNQLTFQIPIAGLPAGLYFVRVIKDGQTYTEKLIKN